MLDQINGWLSQHSDKVVHFAAGAILAGVGSALGLWGAIGLPVALGAAKEVWDHFNPPHAADPWDFVATVLGALPVLFAMLLK